MNVVKESSTEIVAELKGHIDRMNSAQLSKLMEEADAILKMTEEEVAAELGKTRARRAQKEAVA